MPHDTAWYVAVPPSAISAGMAWDCVAPLPNWSSSFLPGQRRQAKDNCLSRQGTRARHKVCQVCVLVGQIKAQVA